MTRTQAARVIGTNRIGISVILRRIEPDAQIFQATTSLPPHRSCPFADTAGESQEIESAKGGGEGADLLS